MTDSTTIFGYRLPPHGSNVVLIGMPGVGKSTLGILLAKAVSATFLDTDILIQARYQNRLAEIISKHGLETFKEIEEKTILDLHRRGTVIATGGSVVYSEKAMAHLRQQGRIIWIEASLELLSRRLGDLNERGVVRKPNQDLKDLYRERQILYRRYAHDRLSCDGLDHEQAVDGLLDLLKRSGCLK